jgi:hypothetical protein
MRNILQHTADSRKGVYCGSKNDPDLTKLVDLGFLNPPRSAGFIPESEGYFYITEEGRYALTKWIVNPDSGNEG